MEYCPIVGNTLHRIQHIAENKKYVRDELSIVKGSIQGVYKVSLQFQKFIRNATDEVFYLD